MPITVFGPGSLKRAIDLGEVQAHQISPALFTLSDEGEMGVRTVDTSNRVEFHTVQIIEDGPDGVWVTGLPTTTRLITVGQEFCDRGWTIDPIYLTHPPPGRPAVTSIIESAISRTRTTLSLLAAIVVAGLAARRIAHCQRRISVPFSISGVAHGIISPRMRTPAGSTDGNRTAQARGRVGAQVPAAEAWRHFLSV